MIMNCLRKIWALPTTLVGLLLAALGMIIARGKLRWEFGFNALCFYNISFLPRYIAGFTLGNVILFKEDGPYCNGIFIGDHEKQHTLQAEVLGFLYIPLHIICLLIYGRNVMKNPLERGPYSHPPRPW